MNGTSCGMLAKTTSLAQPMPSRSAVRSAACWIVRPMSATASMLMPARRRGHVDRGADAPGPRERLGDRLDQRAVAAGEALLDEGGEAAEEVAAAARAAMSSSPAATAHISSAEKPPAATAIGLTEIRLLTIGMP